MMGKREPSIRLAALRRLCGQLCGEPRACPPSRGRARAAISPRCGRNPKPSSEFTGSPTDCRLRGPACVVDPGAGAAGGAAIARRIALQVRRLACGRPCGQRKALLAGPGRSPIACRRRCPCPRWPTGAFLRLHGLRRAIRGCALCAGPGVFAHGYRWIGLLGACHSPLRVCSCSGAGGNSMGAPWWADLSARVRAGGRAGGWDRRVPRGRWAWSAPGEYWVRGAGVVHGCCCPEGRVDTSAQAGSAWRGGGGCGGRITCGGVMEGAAGAAGAAGEAEEVGSVAGVPVALGASSRPWVP